MFLPQRTKIAVFADIATIGTAPGTSSGEVQSPRIYFPAGVELSRALIQRIMNLLELLILLYRLRN